MKFILVWILYSGGHINQLGKVTNFESLKSCKEHLKILQIVTDFKNINHPNLPELEMTGTCVQE